MALRELELAQKTANDKQKTDINKTTEIINSLEKIQNITTPKL